MSPHPEESLLDQNVGMEHMQINVIGDHVLPSGGLGLSTPSRAERKGATLSNK
jgi:hypothetical protein